jgi:hypothetical protein
MFVRFRQSSGRLQLSLVETSRRNGKVVHEHVASLGAAPLAPSVADRVDFWTRLHQRLGRLANRLDDAMQAKILGAVHARVPMPTLDERQALQLDRAKQHEAGWQIGHIQAEGIVAANKALRDGASKMVAEGEPVVANAAEELKAATDRRERIERGENVSLPGKPLTPKDFGFTAAQVRHMQLLGRLQGEHFERYLKIHLRSRSRRDHAELRRYIGSLPITAFDQDDWVEVLERYALDKGISPGTRISRFSCLRSWLTEKPPRGLPALVSLSTMSRGFVVLRYPSDSGWGGRARSGHSASK